MYMDVLEKYVKQISDQRWETMLFFPADVTAVYRRYLQCTPAGRLLGFPMLDF
jgi:hypothetical protein